MPIDADDGVKRPVFVIPFPDQVPPEGEPVRVIALAFEHMV